MSKVARACFAAVASASVIAAVSLAAEVTLSPRDAQQNEACRLLIEAKSCLKQNNAMDALGLLEKAQTLWPDQPHIHYALGQTYARLAEFSRAIAEYKQAMRLEPGLTSALFNMAGCYERNGELSKAIEAYEDYLRKDKDRERGVVATNMIATLRKVHANQKDADANAADYFAAIQSGGRLQRWPQSALPVRVFIADGLDKAGARVQGYKPEFRQILIDAFNSWCDASDGRLAYKIVGDKANADIVCTWTDQIDYLKKLGASVEQGNALVETSNAAEGDEAIRKARIILLLRNSEGNFLSEGDLRKVVLHEVGHTLGICGHSINNADVMFFENAPTCSEVLTSRDRKTMARLYESYPKIDKR
ncbi:MAG TPA: tetratricopeptide repeat protein [Candidatus Obscuribacterales bacterium]